MTHKVDIWVTHGYGCFEIKFNKIFQFGFAPFTGLIVVDYHGEDDMQIELENNDYISTKIYYNTNTNDFEVNVRKLWKHEVTDETIDSVIDNFTKRDWQRHDRTDIVALKALMKRVWERKQSNRITP